MRPTVGMVHQLRRRVASHESTAQRFDREVALQSVTRGPADDPPRVEVEHDREVEPALCRPDVGDVSAPFLVGRIGTEVLRDQVLRNCQIA